MLDSHVASAKEAEADIGFGHVEAFLESYAVLVESLPELASWWPEMDEEERALQRDFFFPHWTYRRELGSLLKKGLLSLEQASRLAELDRQLLEQADLAWLCFHFRPVDLFCWGTPLEQSEEPIRLELRPSTLRAWAALTSS